MALQIAQDARADQVLPVRVLAMARQQMGADLLEQDAQELIQAHFRDHEAQAEKIYE